MNIKFDYQQRQSINGYPIWKIVATNDEGRQLEFEVNIKDLKDVAAKRALLIELFKNIMPVDIESDKDKLRVIDHKQNVDVILV